MSQQSSDQNNTTQTLPQTIETNNPTKLFHKLLILGYILLPGILIVLIITTYLLGFRDETFKQDIQDSISQKLTILNSCQSVFNQNQIKFDEKSYCQSQTSTINCSHKTLSKNKLQEIDTYLNILISKCYELQSKTSPTTARSTELKTYIHPTYRFSFQYPSNLYIRSDSDLHFIGFLQKPDENQTQKLVVSVLENPGNLTLKVFSDKNRPIPDENPPKTFDEKIINNHEALLLKYERCDESFPCSDATKERSFKYLLKDKNYIISFGVDNKYSYNNITQDKQFIESILNTLHFSEGTKSDLSPTQPVYICPPSEYVNCMPGSNNTVEGMRLECSTEHLQWAQKNCPKFKGAAY